MRCSKSGHRCLGYDQPQPNNIDETPYRQLALQRAQERNAQHGNEGPLLPPSSEGFLPFESIIQPINLFAFQEVICRSFLFYKLRIGPHASKALVWWLSPSPRVEIQSSTLVLASRAVSAGFFGRIHQQSKIMIEGARFYGQALRNMRTDISHPEKRYSFEMLGATMALHMYEVCLCLLYAFWECNVADDRKVGNARLRYQRMDCTCRGHR